MYRKGTQNQNADALSRLDTKVPESYATATTTLQPSPFLAQLKEAQMKDEHIQQLHSLLATSQTTFKGGDTHYNVIDKFFISYSYSMTLFTADIPQDQHLIL